MFRRAAYGTVGRTAPLNWLSEFPARVDLRPGSMAVLGAGLWAVRHWTPLGDRTIVSLRDRAVKVLAAPRSAEPPVGTYMSHDASGRVSWTTCPICGGQLAIGWHQSGDEAREVPVEFDCVNRCQLSVSQAVLATEPRSERDWLGPINGSD